MRSPANRFQASTNSLLFFMSNDRMLNLWKKIQEKGLPVSPKKNNFVANSLDPRYDGPLRSFVYNLAVDIVPLEKCRLTLDFDDLFVNRTACTYFKLFLDGRMASEILRAWNAAVRKVATGGERVFQWSDNGNDNDDVAAAEDVACLAVEGGGANALNESQIKFVDELRAKVIRGDEVAVNYGDARSLWPLLRQILSFFWNEFVRSEWYCRYQIDLLTSRVVTLGDILQHETALSYFTQFLEVEGCQSVVEFWLAASNFKQFVENATKNGVVDDNQILDDAINIYEKYLSLLATSPLGFGDDVRSTVEEAICNERLAPTADSFECAVNVALAFLRKYYLVPFLSSQHYVHLLSDMIRQCTSLMSHSTSASISDYGGAGDTKQLNPHLIWQRRKQSGLSFGRIDQLGRFLRDIEPDPGRNEESRITKMMKKFVQRNANRVEEEMAWQVAEMVVKDITDLTLRGHIDTTAVTDNHVCNKFCK